MKLYSQASLRIHPYFKALPGEVSKYWGAAWVEPDQVFAGKVVIFALRADADFALLNSCCHTEWAEKTSSRLKEDPSYSLANTFETLAFPEAMFRKHHGEDMRIEDICTLAILDQCGRHYYVHRRQLMLARNEGLTKTYNRFHDPDETATDIAELRTLHRQLDTSVAAAYGWADLAENDGAALGHNFHETKQGTRFTPTPTARREVLDRLLALNHERHAKEVQRGLNGTKKGNFKIRARKPETSTNGLQTDLSLNFAMSEELVPPVGKRIAAPPQVFAVNLIRALIAEGGGSLSFSLLQDAFVLATRPETMSHVALPEDKSRVDSWALRWNERVSPSYFLSALRELGSRNLMLIDGPNEPIVALVSGSSIQVPPECTYDAWLAHRVAKVLGGDILLSAVNRSSNREIREAILA